MSATPKQQFTIPFRFPGLNDYIKAERGNKYAAANMKKEFTHIAKTYCQQARLEPYKVPVKIGFTFREPNNKRDPDNFIFSQKFCLDGMVLAGLIPEDNQRWIKGFLFHNWEVTDDKDDVGVTITIMEAQDAK